MTDVIDHLNKDATLAADVRDFAITFENRRGGSAALPSSLNAASWRVAKSPGESAADYSTALRRAQEAVRLAQALPPGTRAGYINTVAMAQFRLGQYREALATLAQAEALRAGNPNEQVLSVLIRLKLGQLASARADLEKLLALKTPTNDQRDLIAEAKALSERIKK